MKTLNKAVARYNGISLIVRILVGLINEVNNSL